MAFWNRKTNWEDEYDEYYAQDRRPGLRGERPVLRILAHSLTLLLIGGLFTAGVGFVSGITMVEKLLSALANPLGLVWILLLLLAYFSLLFGQRWPALVALIGWLVLTIGGNQFVADGLTRSLEARFFDTDPFTGEPYDLIVVLGGGTTTSMPGRSQTSYSGDRVVLAGRLYHAGMAGRIVCTGSQKYRAENDLHPREEATEILRGLDVPDEVLLQMKGNNTSEEMANLKIWLAEQEIQGRIGLLTSAWHLPRALRLARSNGLELEPVPANFLSEPFAPGPDIVVPSAENLMVTGQMCKEYLAGLVGR